MDENQEPLVSVIIPCNNNGDKIDKCIESIAAQTHQNIEIIIADNASNDGITRDILKGYEKVEGVNVVRCPQKCSASEVKNNGVINSKGVYYIILEPENLLEETFLEKTVIAMEKSGDVAVVYTDQKIQKENKVIKMHYFDFKELLAKNHIPACSLIRKDAFLKVVAQNEHGYDPDIEGGYENWNFYISVAEQGWKFEYIDQPLVLVKKDPHFQLDFAKKEEMFWSMIQKHSKFYGEYHQYLLKRLYSLYTDNDIYAKELEGKINDSGWLFRKWLGKLTRRVVE